MMNPQTTNVVVGGGLAGLAAATILARGGQTVILCEKSQAVGGRAITENKNGFRFNLGPHALYRGGQGVKVLRELGVDFSGGLATASGAYVIDRDLKHTFPAGMLSLLTTSLFGLPAKLEAARLLTTIGKIDTQSIQHLSVRQWLHRAVNHPDVQRLLAALFRVATYANDPERQSAGAALAQLQRALADNVYYLDGGWQTLVDGLRQAAENAGVKIVTGARVVAVEHDRAVRQVRLADGKTYEASSVIIAASPQVACALVENGDETMLRQWADAAIPVHAACLDLALKLLPQPRARFALGIDRPLYFSVHSAVAHLGPEGGAVIHAAKYLGSDAEPDPKADEQELEALVDLLQPGWRDEVVVHRFLPRMTVSHALVTAAQGGTAGRPGPEVPGIQGLYVVGDWAGPEGMLADASLASAKRAAEIIAGGRSSRHYFAA